MLTLRNYSAKRWLDMNNIKIIEIEKQEEVVSVFPLVKQLRTHLSEKSYIELITEAQEKDGYKMYVLSDNEEIVAFIGFKPMFTLYYGRFVWVCDLVTDEHKRSMGYGERLLSFVENWATDNKYENIALSSGLQRESAHRFYEDKMNYDKVSYVFKKPLK